MKKLLLLLFPIAVFAQSFMLSNIPLPKTYVQNLDPYECDDICMQDYLDNGMIFSFLAHADKKLENIKQNERRTLLISILNLGSIHNTAMVRVAILLPYKKIGKYAASTTNATFAYMMTKSHPFMLKSYKIENESKEEIEKALRSINNDGFNYVIAPLTTKGANNIIELNPQSTVYFPTINKQDVTTSSPTLFFGAIDYNAQSALLIKESYAPLVIFSGKSATGKKLASFQKEEFSQTKHKRVLSYFISRKTTNLEPYLKENKRIHNGSFMINTPIIKSGMILSQLTLYDVDATNILSTQINYDPLLLSMTQYIDRKNMIIANSITDNNNVLIETNSLLSNDIVYNWINYTTTVGVDYFYFLMTNEDRIYNAKMVNNQMIYETELLQPSRSKFIKYN